MTSPKPPTLRTERLLLRPFEQADAGAIQRLAGAYEIARYTTLPHPYEDGMAEAWIEKSAREFLEGTLVNFAVVEQAGEALVGCVGLKVNPPNKRAELGYWIGTPFWGNGYCTEAARAVVQYGFEDLELHRIYALYCVTNEASGRVMKKLGMQYEGRQREHIQRFGFVEDALLYGVLRKEWRE